MSKEDVITVKIYPNGFSDITHKKTKYHFTTKENINVEEVKKLLYHPTEKKSYEQGR